MARKERERYTERSRPHRREPGKSGGGGRSGTHATEAADSPWRNPVVMVAIGALVIAGALALGVVMGRQPAADTATTDTATPAAQEEGTAELATPVVAEVAPPTAAAAITSTAGTKTYAAPEDQALDPAANSYFATFQTAKGTIVAQLWPDLAPQHVNSFVFLARDGFYDGTTFHRLEPGFIVQGGDPTHTGMGGPGYSVPAEFNADNPVPHRMGTLAMARTNEPDSAGSQFYFVLEDGPSATSLDRLYTVFGHVVQGMDVVQQLAVGDVMDTVTIEEKPASESIVTPDDIRAGNLPANN